ncbi:hypothetical protein NDU88_008089 [Pleurodeles waltl]|uniref:Uncharacterized protein n=1 Tax=Pleurodeles waltl TaxID=8319 RepID=A0AAV7N402_PLEWA|nr:hypothetical protein NDU88_008089 [Pleurodeles waltl]
MAPLTGSITAPVGFCRSGSCERRSLVSERSAQDHVSDSLGPVSDGRLSDQNSARDVTVASVGDGCPGSCERRAPVAPLRLSALDSARGVTVAPALKMQREMCSARSCGEMQLRKNVRSGAPGLMREEGLLPLCGSAAPAPVCKNTGPAPDFDSCDEDAAPTLVCELQLLFVCIKCSSCVVDTKSVPVLKTQLLLLCCSSSSFVENAALARVVAAAPACEMQLLCC